MGRECGTRSLGGEGCEEWVGLGGDMGSAGNWQLLLRLRGRGRLNSQRPSKQRDTAPAIKVKLSRTSTHSRIPPFPLPVLVV